MKADTFPIGSVIVNTHDDWLLCLGGGRYARFNQQNCVTHMSGDKWVEVCAAPTLGEALDIEDLESCTNYYVVREDGKVVIGFTDTEGDLMWPSDTADTPISVHEVPGYVVPDVVLDVADRIRAIVNNGSTDMIEQLVEYIEGLTK